MILDPKLPGPSWQLRLQDEFEKPYFKTLDRFLEDAYKNKIIYPKASDIFRAFQETPFEKVKIIILGQDPYHGEGQAEGLAFSVPKECPIPPSLVNIFKELQSDLGISMPFNGSLISWAHQGVLLLNTILTVEAEKPKSHHKQGWEIFTDKAIQLLVEDPRPLVFILWGNSAKEKYHHIAKKNDPLHYVLISPHPSPLSSYHGFFGSKPFSKANTFLRKHDKEEINWRIP